MENEKRVPPNGEYVRMAVAKLLEDDKIEITYAKNPDDFEPGDAVHVMRGEDYLWITGNLKSGWKRLIKF